MSDQRELFAVPSSPPAKKPSRRGNPAPRRTIEDLEVAIARQIVMTGRGPANYEEVALLLETTWTQAMHTLELAQMARRVEWDKWELNLVPPLDTKARILRDADMVLNHVGFTPATIRTRLIEFLQELAAESKKAAGVQ